ncbi:MAG: metallophosphoesterase [Acidobacteria bacterium]|nr:metallophosphoesterase [Acidobacteriota bacterium]
MRPFLPNRDTDGFRAGSALVGLLGVLLLPGLCPVPAAAGPVAPGPSAHSRAGAFTLILGNPTATSVDAGVLAETDLEGWFEYGSVADGSLFHTDPAHYPADVPLTVTMGSLQPDAGCTFRFHCRPPGGGEYTVAAEASFHTRRLPGSAFTFTVQADPHVGDTGFVPALYQRTLENVRADAPDFHVDLGDTFLTEKLAGTPEEETQTFLAGREYFGLAGPAAPVFLVNGNHEGELGWKRDGAADNLAIRSTLNRRRYYPCPSPGGFYSGGVTPEPGTGVRDGYYAWTWGDALFVVLDPFWYTLKKPNGVNVVFHGHDHVFVRQEKDGIVYQECPRPSFNQANAVADAAAAGYLSGDVLASPGHLRVRVTPSRVTVEYVRASLSDPDTNGTVAHRYTLSPAADPGAFPGNVVLGCPTATSVKANLFSAVEGGEVCLEYGPAPGEFTAQTPVENLAAGVPLEIRVDGLTPDTLYAYRTRFRAAGATDFSPGPVCRFRTARAAGSTFTFCVQGDSHPERANSQFDADLYTRTLLTASADQPDFYFALGDDFSVDTLDPITVTEAQVAERYVIQRPFLGVIGAGAPVFLVNGNHEQAARYLLDGTPDNVAVWAQNARNRYYSQPAPDGFYTGNTEWVPFIGLLRNYYAWTWGDALFVTLDPYWGSSVCVDNPFYGGPKHPEMWDITLGEAQYRWLKNTLERSPARYKFVFAHHVHGTGRGGIEQADLYEWGGWNKNGGWGFDTRRPGWPQTIHQLMASTGVTVFFQGHDHIWVRQARDGVIYQTLPEPADPNYTLYNADAFVTGDKFPNTGYTRVTISPSGGQVDYVRTYLPQDEGPGSVNGAVAFSYPILPTGVRTARCGDADGSEGVNAADLLLLAHYLDGDAIVDVADVPYLDLDGSGDLGVPDLLTLQLYLSGQLDAITCSGRVCHAQHQRRRQERQRECAGPPAGPRNVPLPRQDSRTPGV